MKSSDDRENESNDDKKDVRSDVIKQSEAGIRPGVDDCQVCLKQGKPH